MVSANDQVGGLREDAATLRAEATELRAKLRAMEADTGRADAAAIALLPGSRGAFWEARGRSRRARGGLFGRWRLFALLKAAGGAGRAFFGSGP